MSALGVVIYKTVTTTSSAVVPLSTHEDARQGLIHAVNADCYNLVKIKELGLRATAVCGFWWKPTSIDPDELVNMKYCSECAAALEKEGAIEYHELLS